MQHKFDPNCLLPARVTTPKSKTKSAQESAYLLPFVDITKQMEDLGKAFVSPAGRISRHIR